MKTRTIIATAAVASALALGSTATAGVLFSDNFNSDTQALNWSGDATFASLPQPTVGGQSSTDLIGTGFFDFLPGNGNYVDLDGSTGTGFSPAGYLQSTASVGPGVYTVQFDLAGNQRGVAPQTTDVYLGSQLIAALTLPSSQGFTAYSFTVNSATGGNLIFDEVGPATQQGNLLDNVVLSGGVPEPSSWALMILGVAAVGAGLRRRTLTAAI